MLNPVRPCRTLSPVADPWQQGGSGDPWQQGGSGARVHAVRPGRAGSELPFPHL